MRTLDFAILQGQIYEQLFSTTAQKQPEAIRVQRARDFAGKIKKLRDPAVTVSYRYVLMPNPRMPGLRCTLTDIVVWHE